VCTKQDQESEQGIQLPFPQGSGAAFRTGEVGKSITFVLHIISIYSVPNIVEISHSKMKRR